MTTSISEPVQPSASGGLRSMMGMWAVAAFLPLPVLVTMDPVSSADVSCIYLGVINAWLVTEFHRAWGLPGSAASWRVRMLAITTAISVNVALFVGFGLDGHGEYHYQRGRSAKQHLHRGFLCRYRRLCLLLVAVRFDQWDFKPVRQRTRRAAAPPSLCCHRRPETERHRSRLAWPRHSFHAPSMGKAKGLVIQVGHTIILLGPRATSVSALHRS
jgi:hypothetical protein